MSRRLSTVSQIPTFVERTDLPRIQVNTRGGARYSAYVNGYISGARCRVKGANVIPIYYLSMVAMDGDGGKLQGIWAALVSNPPQDVYLEGVGTVVLAHHDPQFESLGYSLHWNYQQVSSNDRENALHGVIESNMLTVCDPMAGAAPVRRGHKQNKTANKRKRKAGSHNMQLSTVTKKELGAASERIHREKRPLFMLMVAGNVRPESVPEEAAEVYAARCEEAEKAILIQQHFAFLDLRVPQPLSLDWADFLWQRAIQAQENTRLTVWFKEVAQGDNEDQKALPVIQSAWLCRPNIARLDADRRLVLHSGCKTALCEQVSSEVENAVVVPV